MINRLFFILLIIAFWHGGFSQSESNLDGSILLRHERSYGVNLHSGGWGLSYNKATFRTAFSRSRLEFDFVSMKHPKEIRSLNSYYSNSRSFVFGKLNYIYVARGGIGQQRTLYTKPLVNGVELRRIYTGGFSLAVSKPVYLYVTVPDSLMPAFDNAVAERYDPLIHSPHSIIGRGPFSKGFDELGLYPGVYARAALNFEFGPEYEIVRALEAGAIADLYLRPINMMAYNKPSWYFINFYIAVYFGSRYNK